MNRFLKVQFIVVGLICSFGSYMLFAQTPQVSFNSSTSQLDSLYADAIKSYHEKDYAKAIAIFNQIQGLSPSYKQSQIAHYIRTAKSRLGKSGSVDVFNPSDQRIKEISITKEGELEAMLDQSQKVLLDVAGYIESIEKDGKLTEFQLLGPKSSLKMAKEAYENSQYTEAIRLANKARFQIDELLGQKKPGIVLGKVADYPVTLNLTDADLQQTLKLIYDLTGANIVMSQGITGRVSINVKDLPLQRVLDLICEANNLRYIEDNGVIKIMTIDEFNKSPAGAQSRMRRVFQVHYGDAAGIMKALKETFPLQTIVCEPRTNSIVIDAPDDETATKISDVISALDTPISQVLIEAKLVDITLSDDNSFSIDWLISSRLASGLDATVTGPKFGVNPTHTPGVSSSLPQDSFSFGVTNNDVNILIQALSAKGQVKMLQAPKIMCLNGTTAIISVETNVPYLIPK
ncbi:MAG TPA: hypothetical protein PKX05_05090, partial [bacterium]|nr:hypothetical protein [bacterium]